LKVKIEQGYVEWLQRVINADPTAKYTVKLDRKIQRDPLARAKQLTIVEKTEITHVFDYESEEPTHAQRFQTTLERMKKAQNLGKSIKYQLGYSNFTFELWIILHKADCNSPLNHRHQYLTPLNQAYGEHFESLDQYKHEDNFKRILGQLTLDHVREAIRRSKAIMRRNQAAGCILQRCDGYGYYKENPALSIWKIIEKILKECNLV
jgi:hypothetical protein